uniref:Uncharacterized protein n=2 Tax=Metallosphaera hakonensis TaxID=79601 RepID=A0A2U9IWF1_9CREN
MTMLGIAITLLFLALASTMFYYGYASNVPYVKTYQIPSYSYQAQLNLWDNFHINDSILFNNQTCINSSSMFSKLVEGVNLMGNISVVSNGPIVYNGSYVIYQYIQTSEWSKFIGEVRGDISDSSPILFKITPNVTYLNNLTQKINNQVGLSYTHFSLKVVVFANLTLHHGNYTVPVSLEKSMQVYFGSINYSVSQDPGGNVTQTFYHDSVIHGMTGYNRMLFLSGGVFAVFGGISFMYGSKVEGAVSPEVLAERTIRRLSVKGALPHSSLPVVKVNSARGFLRMVKTLNRVPVEFDNGFYFIDSDTFYVWYRS